MIPDCFTCDRLSRHPLKKVQWCSRMDQGAGILQYEMKMQVRAPCPDWIEKKARRTIVSEARLLELGQQVLELG